MSSVHDSIMNRGVLISQVRYASNNQLKMENVERDEQKPSQWYSEEAKHNGDAAMSHLSESLGTYTVNRQNQELNRLMNRPRKIFTAPRFTLGQPLVDPMAMQPGLQIGDRWVNARPFMKPSTLPTYTGPRIINK